MSALPDLDPTLLREPGEDDVLSFEAGALHLRDEGFWEDWVVRLELRPMIFGTFVRAPIGDRRHGRGAPLGLPIPDLR